MDVPNIGFFAPVFVHTEGVVLSFDCVEVKEDVANYLFSGRCYMGFEAFQYLFSISVFNFKDEEMIKALEKTANEIKNCKAIVFCRNIAHIQHLIKYFPPGKATYAYSAKMSGEERRKNIRNFREGNYQYILTCNLFNEGIDIPETNLLAFLRTTNSRLIWLQQLGRGLRKTKEK